MLIKIEAIVREEKFEQVKSALQDIQVNGVTISQVMGYGTQRGYTEIVRGSEVDILLHPKIKFEVVVSSEEWEQKTISAIQKAAFTGEVGDGKIFSYEIRSAVKIRTKETGYNAVKYSDGDLKIVLSEDGEIRISNHASGLSEVQAERLFDRFYTVNTARKSTGLGLSIAKALMEKMGGTITADYRENVLEICVNVQKL